VRCFFSPSAEDRFPIINAEFPKFLVSLDFNPFFHLSFTSRTEAYLSSPLLTPFALQTLSSLIPQSVLSPVGPLRIRPLITWSATCPAENPTFSLRSVSASSSSLLTPDLLLASPYPEEVVALFVAAGANYVPFVVYIGLPSVSPCVHRPLKLSSVLNPRARPKGRTGSLASL